MLAIAASVLCDLTRVVWASLAQDRENVVLDAFDVFCAHWPSVASRMRVAVSVAALWGVDSSRLEHLIAQRKPNVAVADETWTVGRVALPTSCKHPTPLPTGFAPTRHGLCMLERLAAGVMMGEPMLLVGGELPVHWCQRRCLSHASHG